MGWGVISVCSDSDGRPRGHTFTLPLQGGDFHARRAVLDPNENRTIGYAKNNFVSTIRRTIPPNLTIVNDNGTTSRPFLDPEPCQRTLRETIA